jgi:hypothetical protein
MKALLSGLLPRLFPGLVDGQNFLCVEHQGKSDLDKSIPIKLRAWCVPDDRFVIVRDSDNANCVDLKARFVAMCRANGRPDTLVRLVCQELESWYIGDLAALAAAYPGQNVDTHHLRKRFVTPDAWQKPSLELARLVSGFQKNSGARALAQHLTKGGNRSHSFNVFVGGVCQLAQSMGYRNLNQ